MIINWVPIFSTRSFKNSSITSVKLALGIIVIAFIVSCMSSGVTRESNEVLNDKKIQDILKQYKQNKFSHKSQPDPSEAFAVNDEPKKLSIPKVGASESPRNDTIHDHGNDSLASLQSPVVAMANFPRDRRNQVDWVAALEQGKIEPRANITGEDEMITMDMDILMKNTQFMPYVKFPHLAHTKWLACSNCHPAIFVPQEHANQISMNKVLRGRYCGVCHDKVAFAIFICERCHSVPHEGSGKKWW